MRIEKQIEKAISQELETARPLQAKVYVITDGKKSIWEILRINMKFCRRTTAKSPSILIKPVQSVSL